MEYKNCNMEKIVLDNISIKSNLVEYHYSVSSGIKKFFTTDCMFIEYEEDMTNVPTSILTIPFVNCMTGLSWLADCVLFVDEIDATYYDSFKDLKVAYNELHRYMDFKGMLVPSKIVENKINSTNNKGLLLWGGGVDCHTSFIQNKENISHILNIYGWLNKVDENNRVDNSDKEQAAHYAEKMGISALHVRSNFASQFNHQCIDKEFRESFRTSYWYGLLHSMAFLSIATPLAWIHGIKDLFIASSFTKGKVGIKCASYITADSEFRFATYGKTIHDGFELSRQDKVKVLVDYQKQINAPYLIQACSFNDHNCCECEKCFRTIIGLVAENADPRSFGFDIKGSLVEHWKKIIDRDVALWGPEKENYYYGLSAQRMRENYDSIENKEFVDWFLSLDFSKMKKKSLKKYYRQNFFSIIKRKLGF